MVELKELPAHLEGHFVADSVRISLDASDTQARVDRALSELQVAVGHSGPHVVEFPSTRETSEEIFAESQGRAADKPKAKPSRRDSKSKNLGKQKTIDFTPPDLSRIDTGGRPPPPEPSKGCCVVM